MDFIPLAEESGLILPIGDWGLAEACSQIQKWCREDPAHQSLRVCVNLSARQFSREGLADHVEALLRQSGISSRQLGLEMTESSLIPNMRTALEVLGSLRRLGVSLLMDDFGTGYSSLNHLHSFPFDVLKIDRSFVGRMTEGDQPLQIVRTIIELARVLGMDVVAEGIETREQYRLLRELGCRFGQGFLFARPLPAEAVTRLVASAGPHASRSRAPARHSRSDGRRLQSTFSRCGSISGMRSRVSSFWELHSGSRMGISSRSRAWAAVCSIPCSRQPRTCPPPLRQLCGAAGLAYRSHAQRPPGITTILPTTWQRSAMSTPCAPTPATDQPDADDRASDPGCRFGALPSQCGALQASRSSAAHAASSAGDAGLESRR